MDKKVVPKERKFWNTQPVPQTEGVVQEVSVATSGPIDPVKDPVKDISPNPLPLPANFEWCTCDVTDPVQIKEIYELLNANYVEDDDAMFRFDYGVPFLHWALTPPGYQKEWHVGVRASTNKKLVAFITGIPVDCKIYDKQMKMAEINFLCVHKKLRDKRLAPVLIKEVTRRVNRMDIWQAVYTAGVVIPHPVSACRYYHRSLQPKKLIDIGFSHLKPKWTMAMTIRFYKTAEKTALPFRPMEPKDAPQMTVLLNTYLEKFGLRVHFSEEETLHWLLPRENVVECYVLEDPATKSITDFFSFYNLPSTVIGHPVHKGLKAAYSYYNIFTKHTLKDIMSDACIIANKKGYDVFNALDLMQNKSFLEDLKFGGGDGTLNYYLYNWNCPSMPTEQVGLVLFARTKATMSDDSNFTDENEAQIHISRSARYCSWTEKTPSKAAIYPPHLPLF